MLNVVLALAPVAGYKLFAETPGFAYLGTGYDVLFGNPLATGGMGDEGLKPRAIFDFTYDKGMTTTDDMYQIPDDTNARVFSSCSTEMKQENYNSAYSYQKMIDNSFDISAKIGLPSQASIDFNLGVDVRNTRNHTNNQEEVYAHVSSTCTAYQLSMNLFKQPNITEDFQYGVQAMPVDYDIDEYAELMDAYGTHYISELKAGGRWGLQMSFKSKDYQSLLDNYVDVHAGIGFTAGASSGKLNISSKTDEKTMYMISSAVYENTTFNTGGEYNADPEVWMQSVKKEPMPVHMVLKPLYDLFDTRHLPMEDPTDLKAKKANMKKALQDWCNWQMTQDPTFNCTPQEPKPMPTPAPIGKNAIRRVCVTNQGGFMLDWHMETTNGISAETDSFVAGKTECLDGTDVDAENGDFLGCECHATAGKTVMCDKPWYQYSSQSNLQSNYICTGTTGGMDCKFDRITTIGTGPSKATKKSLWSRLFHH